MMQTMKSIPSTIKMLILALAIAAGTGVAYLLKQRSYVAQEQELPFTRYLFNDDERDIQDVEKLFADPKNGYLLHTRPAGTYNVRAMMSNRMSHYEDPSTYGDLTIMIARDTKTGDLIGFTAHHKVTFYKSKLLFLAVDEAQRGKGYGKKLAQAAIADMKREGALRVILDVREENKPARTLYESLGFKPGPTSHGFVKYELSLT
jgi:ribosomal protein S18 acetylase RimI-like enzyme